MRLFTEVSRCDPVRALRQLAPEERAARIRDLATWYEHVHAESSNQFLLGGGCGAADSPTVAQQLSDAGLWVSNYRNGSYVSQARKGEVNANEAADLEERAPLGIGTFWPGDYRNGPSAPGAAGATLTLPLSPEASSVELRAATPPPGKPPTWPFSAPTARTKGPGAHSTSTADAVPWVRINDELLQITAPPELAGGVVRLSVRRGLWGTRPAAHPAATRVMAPAYVGSSAAVATDVQLAGSPKRNDASSPLRYVLKIWRPDAIGWLAGRVTTTFGRQGYNTVWLDVSSCAQYNVAAASGHPVSGWDDQRGHKLDPPAWGEYQKAKVAGLRQQLPGWKFTGNNLSSNGGPCNDDLLATGFDGGVLEHWMKPQLANGQPLDWQAAMRQNLAIQANNWPAIYWVRWQYAFEGSVEAYKRFSYGSLLLALGPQASRFQYGGPWGFERPDDLYFLNWGRPKDDTVELAALGRSGPQVRDFDNGQVIVNPTSSKMTVSLPTAMFNVSDGASGGSAITQVDVGPFDAAFVMRQVPPAPR